MVTAIITAVITTMVAVIVLEREILVVVMETVQIVPLTMDTATADGIMVTDISTDANVGVMAVHLANVIGTDQGGHNEK